MSKEAEDIHGYPCSCGAVYTNIRSRDAHVQAMQERNDSFPKPIPKDADNQPEKHEATT